MSYEASWWGKAAKNVNSIFRWSYNHWPSFALFVTSAVVALLSVLIGLDFSDIKGESVSKFEWGLLIGLIILLLLQLVFFILSTRREQTLSSLNDRLDSLQRLGENYEDLIQGYLFNLASRRLKFKTSERISLYIHNSDDHNGVFTQVGRYSSNPSYSDKSEYRGIYPDSEGIIAIAWNNEWAFDNSFPDPDQNLAEYISYSSEKYNIPRDTLDNMEMRSRLYFGCHVKDAKGRHPVAVIIIESTEADKYSEQSLRDTMKTERNYISYLLEILRSSLPDPYAPGKEGF